MTSAKARAGRDQAPATAGKYLSIDLHLIDEPALPMRQTFDEGKLAELVESIRVLGVIQPVVLERTGARYRIVAGHRRCIAAVPAGLKRIPALVFEPGRVDVAATMAHENTFREDLNPAEEGLYLAHVLEARCGDDVDALCAFVKQRREYVESRLLLVRGDPKVMDGVRANRITFAVGRELNRIQDGGYRHMYLDAAEKGGASARLVNQWRVDQERNAAMIASAVAADGAPQAEASAPLPEPPQMACWFCAGAGDPHNLRLRWVHEHCEEAAYGAMSRCSTP